MRVVAKDVTSIRSTAEETRSSVDRLHLNNYQRKVIKWLHAPDPSTNYNKALKQRQGGSGLWFLQNDVFAGWKTRQNSFLWLNGIPGCGKTIISSTIIEHLEKTLPCKLVLYFYFNFNDKGKQTLHNMLCALISQLYPKNLNNSQEQALESLFSSCQDGRRQADTESLREIFFNILDHFKEVWLVLDAIDECCTRKGTEGLLSWIREALQSNQRNIHLLMTSRPEHDIEVGIRKYACNDDIFELQSSLITNDIRAYAHMRVSEDNAFRRWRSNPKVQNEIETQITEKADGM
jgi:hypothetical protein